MATTIDLGKIRLQWKGDYSNATSYELLDVVKFKGDSYVFISTIAAANKTPDTTSEWDLMVSGGDQWSTGTSVPTGGNPGDMYLKTDDEKIYENVAGTWTVKLDIGGGVWTSSTSNGSGGESGDWHVNTATKDIQENVSGTWTTRVNLSVSGSNIQDLGNVPALSSGKFLTNDGTSTSWATVDVTGASVGGDVSGTVSNIQIAANAVTDTELNSAKLNNVADNANNYSHPGTHPASMLTGALPAIDGSALTNLPAGGKVLQVVSSTSGHTSLTAPTTESDIGLNLNITPQAGSKLLLIVTAKYHLVNVNSAWWHGYWFKDSTNIGHAFYVNQDQDGGNTDETAVGQKYYTDAAFNGSTSFEFSLRISQVGGYTRHGFSGTSTITAIEIGA